MILVTGAAGFIGSHVCEYYTSRNIACLGIDNFDPFYKKELKEQNLKKLNDSPHFDFVEMDICDKAGLKSLFSKYEVSGIIHLAALAGVRPSLKQPDRYFEVNVNGTINILDAAKEASVKNIVLASSSSVYGNSKTVPFNESDFVDNPISPYAASKKAMELAAHTYYHLYDLKIACLRFFTVYGPRQRPDLAIAKFCRLITNNESIDIYGDGSTYRDYTYIDDIIDGIHKAYTWIKEKKDPQFEVFNLGESNTVKLSYLIDLIQNSLHKKADIHYLPEQPGDVKRTFANVQRARDILKYNPIVAIEDGIERYVEWLNSNG